jgi:hypothetical protein
MRGLPGLCMRLHIWLVVLYALQVVVHSAHLILDAVPKKRGPKTDVLEALLKRVDGLEKRLRTEEGPDSQSPTTPTREAVIEVLKHNGDSPPNPVRSVTEIAPNVNSATVANGTPSTIPSSEQHG